MEQGESTKTERALVDSLRVFVRTVKLGDGAQGDDGQQSGVKDLGFLQVVFLLALVLDITLSYFVLISLIPGGEENRVVLFLHKVLPAVGGTLAISYFDRLRRWIFEHSGSPRLGIPFVILLPLLLLPQAPIYSVFVQVEPGDASVSLQSDDGKSEPTIFSNYQTRNFLLVRLRFYRATVGSREPVARYQVTRLQIVKGTIARLPLLRRFLEPLKLAAVYTTTIDFGEAQGGQLFISAPIDLHLETLENLKDSGFVRIKNTKNQDPRCATDMQCWTKTESTSIDLVSLPGGGPYEFVFQVKDCDPSRAWKSIANMDVDVKLPESCA